MSPKNGWGLLLAAAVAISAGCSGSASAPVSAGPPPAPPRAFDSPSQAQALLLQLEDRRAFDASTLEGAAKYADEAVRAHAALAAGRIGSERGRGVIRKLLADRSPKVRAAAAFACQVMEASDLTPDLIPMLSDPDPAVEESAARSIGFLARGDGQDALTAAIPKAASPEPRAAMLRSLWRFANEASVSAALPYAADSDPKVRFAAVYALARKPIGRSVPALTAALSDSDADTAAAAARALGILEKKESAGPLAAVLDSGKPHLVTSALYALEAILEKNPGLAIPEDRKAKILALAGDANGNLAIPALYLLRQLVGADREALQRVWSIAMTGPGRRRQVALLSAVAALRERAKPALEASIDSPEAPLRAAAAESLAYLSTASAAPYRQKLVGDRDPLVRIAAVSSLRTAEAVRDNRALVDAALSDTDPGVRASAIEALSLLDDARVIPLLIQAVQRSVADSAPDVPIAAVTAAEKMRTLTEARAVVEAAYHHPKTLVARLARRSLVQSFRADPSAYPLPEYKTGKTTQDYAALLAEAAKPWKAEVETTRGTFAIRLLGGEAPMTVMNFVGLARRKFFDGVAIHRVVPDFVVQDGDPSGTGSGGPGYEIRDENNPTEYGTGTVGMALSGPDTGGSQWFVTHAPEPHLDGIYTVFGQVVSGQDVVERIEQWDRITRVTVSETP